jgi:phosphatidylglycerophosphatase A
MIAALLATLIGIWACGVHARKIGIYDPSECVLDEVAGQWFALLPIALATRGADWWPFVMAFLFFRLFDIWKPWPVSALERLPGGYGIMMDDVLAGLIAAALLYGALGIGLV